MFASAERFADRGAGTIPVSLNPAPGHRLRSALITSPGELDMKNDTFHLRTDARHGNLELSYLFGYARMTRNNVSDQDVGLALDPELRALPNPPLAATYDEERRTDAAEFVSTQHELQLKPLGGERLDWIAGAFFYEENNSIRFDIDVRDDRGALPGVPDSGDVRYSQAFIQPDRKLSSWAGFGQLTWHLSDSARASAGARYTRRHQAGSQRNQRRMPHAERHHRQRRFQSRRHLHAGHSLRAESGLAGCGAGHLPHHRAQRRSQGLVQGHLHGALRVRPGRRTCSPMR